jgi:hypothetical protein
MGKGHNRRQSGEERTKTERRGFYPIDWNTLRLCAGRVPAQGKQVFPKSRLIKGSSAYKGEQQQQQKPVLNPEPVATKEL